MCAWPLFAQDSPNTNSTQAPAPAQGAAPSPAVPPNPPQATKGPEVATIDTPAMFRVRVNLVLVRAVVRDSQGKVVENLHREDFALADGRNPQVISFFNVETPGSHAIPVTTAEGANGEVAGGASPKAALPAIPQRFVSVLYDDVHMNMQDAVTVRDATTRLFGALAPTDRVGIFTTSGQATQDFTSDRDALTRVLNGIVPRSVTGHIAGVAECPDLSYYQADLIENKRDTQALAAATAETIDCAFQGDPTKAQIAQVMAESTAQRELSSGDAESEYAYRHIEDAMRRLASMPGQRVMVFVSPGFILAQLFIEAHDIIDRATRTNIVIDTIDARGLYTPDLGDIADPPSRSPRVIGIKSMYRVSAQSAQSEILAEFAAGTGGTYFHNRNDLDEGLRQAVAAPPVSYVLGFSPQNLKLNGSYHTLKVTLTGKQKFNIQARRGYYAPRKAKDPAETAKEEIQEAILSQDEIHDLPVDLQTQFFKPDASQAKLSVVAHVDLKSVRFRKAEGRNLNDITLATAIFDENGNFVTGGEKIVQMKLLDGTLDRLGRSGINVKSSFDVKPGSYLVRLVVRDAEGEQMAAKNGAVVIPN